MVTSTYTYVLLDVSPDTYYEIYDKLLEAGYDHCFHLDDGHVVIDMHGIALNKRTLDEN
jgi:hypothetical protein